MLTVTAACPSCAQPYRSSSRWMLPTLQRISRSPLARAGPSVPCRSLMGVTDASPGDWGPPVSCGTPKSRGVQWGKRVVGWVWWLAGFGGSKRLLDIKVWWPQKIWGPSGHQGLVAIKDLGVPEASKVWCPPRSDGPKDLVGLKGFGRSQGFGGTPRSQRVDDSKGLGVPRISKV